MPGATVASSDSNVTSRYREVVWYGSALLVVRITRPHHGDTIAGDWRESPVMVCSYNYIANICNVIKPYVIQVYYPLVRTQPDAFNIER